MSAYLSRTDGELVALARRGDRVARAVLVDRTLLPASRVAMHLERDADHAVQVLVAAYGDTFDRLGDLEASGGFLPVLLDRLDHRAPFPLDPAAHAPLDPVDRDRVRGAVLGVPRTRRGVPLLAGLVAAAVVGLAVTGTSSPPDITVEEGPAGAGRTPGTAPAPTPRSTGTTAPPEPIGPTAPTGAATPTERAEQADRGTNESTGATAPTEATERGTGPAPRPTELADTR